jgi:hypothetical protein
MSFDGQDGRLFDFCLDDETCSGLFSSAVANALDKVGGLDLDAQAEETAAMLAPWQALEVAPRKPFSSGQIAAAVTKTREFIADRPAEAEAWLAAHPPDEPIVVVDPISEPEDRPAPSGGTQADRGITRVNIDPARQLLSVGRSRFADGVLRTSLELAAGGTVVQTGEVHRRGGDATICGDRAKATGPGSMTLRCELPDWVRQRLQRHRVWVTLTIQFAGLEGSAKATRRLALPRQ